MVAVPTSVGIVKSEEEEISAFLFFFSGFTREEERSESLESARRLREVARCAGGRGRHVMDWRRYLKTEEGHGDPSPGEPAEEEATEEVVFLQRSLSLTERTRLGLSEAWYSWVERFGLQRLRSIVSGVATLPETDEPLYLLGKRYETLNRGEKEDEKEDDDAQQRAKERTEAFAEDLGSRAWVTYRR